ncbi:hypothetical protein OAJ30_01095 [Alphaproteobacteria bacterium]|nr:hypothetical protein [Alphaproteobacteria bacterium]
MKHKIYKTKDCDYCHENIIFEYEVMCSKCKKDNNLIYKFQSMPLILRMLIFTIIGIFLFYIFISIKPTIDELIDNFYEENVFTILGIIFLLPWIAAAIYIIRVIFK